MLVDEIERIRATIKGLSTDELQRILRIFQEASRDASNNDILVSASQLLQTVSDDSMLSHIMSLEKKDEQRAVYLELIVSR